MDKRIEILNKFMKNKDERLVVCKNRDKEVVYLRFKENPQTEWTIAAIEESTGQLYDYEIHKYAPKELFCYLSRFKGVFEKAYNNLFNNPLYYELEQLQWQLNNLTQKPLKTEDEDDLETVLNKYMWTFDDRFLVEYYGETIKLFFTDDDDENGTDYLLITYDLNKRLFEFENLKLRETKFLEATQYYCHFIKKVKELF